MVTSKQREECLRLMTNLHPICENITQAELNTLCDFGVLRECTPGEPILLQDQIADQVYIILQGNLLVWRASYTGSQRLFFARRSAGQIIGEVSGSNPRAFFAGGMQAETDCVLLGLTQRDYEELIRRGGQFAWNVVHCLSDKIRYAGQRLEALTRHSVQGRIANEIVLLAEQVGEADANGNVEIRLPRSLAEIAEWLNVEPPTLSRELKKLKEEKKVIDYDKGAKVITVINLPRLKSLCHR